MIFNPQHPGQQPGCTARGFTGHGHVAFVLAAQRQTIVINNPEHLRLAHQNLWQPAWYGV